MNLREGLRRTGLVLGGFVTLISLAVYGTAYAPSQSSIDWDYSSRITSFVYESQTPEYRASTQKYAMEDEIWPKKTAGQIVESACTSSATNGLAKHCADYKDDVKWLWWAWVKHVFTTFLVASAASAVFWLLWGSFSWVILGFTQPSAQPPRS